MGLPKKSLNQTVTGVITHHDQDCLLSQCSLRGPQCQSTQSVKQSCQCRVHAQFIKHTG